MKNKLLISCSAVLRYSLIIIVYAMLQGCSSMHLSEENSMLQGQQEPAMNTLESLGVPSNTVYPVDIYDPWESMNRSIYNFNAQLDSYVLIPVVDGYRAYIPKFLRQGIHNIYSNLTSVNHTVNSALQLKPQTTANNGMRLISNTTIGIGGLFDVATGMGFPEIKEDFGQVLGHWGVANGPYLVLPFFGPSNLRDTTGLVGDFFIADIYLDGLGMNGGSNANTWVVFYYGLMGIDLRANTDFRYYDSLTPFEYDFIRMMYTAQRRILIGE